jgi:cyclic-di-GMP phosphodiesterase TipF (flagellum assembly factor)
LPGAALSEIFQLAWSIAQSSAVIAFAHLDVPSAILGGGLTVLLMLQFRAGRLRKRLARDVAEDLDDLRAANVAIKNSLDHTKRQMADVTLALTKKSELQEKKVVGELQIIECLIRDFAARRASGQTLVPVDLGENEIVRGVSQSAPAADPQLFDIVRRSLEENRVDLYLQPVVSLPQRKVRFYEALSRLRSEDGTIIMPAQYIRIAAPAGLMSVVDNLLLFRCVQVVKRLTQKNRDIGIFCNISGHTLRDAEFFPQFLGFLREHREMASQIIFEFAQDAILDATAHEEENLKALMGLGFRLSMDQIATLDFDFARAKRLGFHFLKVKADILISGMHDANAAVAAEDFKDLLGRNGLNLIAERVEDEKSVVQLLEYNVDFAQGYVFSEPKPIRDVGEINDPRAPQPAPAKRTLFSAGLARRLAG